MGCGSSSKQTVSDPKTTPADDAKQKPTRKFEDFYSLGKQLGEGSFAEIFQGVNKKTKQVVAIKVIDKGTLLASNIDVKDEIETLIACGEHPNILRLIEVFEDEDFYQLVTDNCDGGDLFSRIVNVGFFTEKIAVEYCKQLASALQYMHSKGIVHRDLKPENLLLMTEKNAAGEMVEVIKVADFGLAKLVKNDNMMKTVCGTWAYCAPEVIQQKPYNHTVDTWSLGILTYMLMGGYHPFDPYGNLREPQLMHRIVEGQYDFEDPEWDCVSPKAIEIIKGCMQTESANRITLTEYLESDWIKDSSNHSDAANPRLITKLKALIRATQAVCQLRKKAKIRKDKREKAALENPETAALDPPPNPENIVWEDNDTITAGTKPTLERQDTYAPRPWPEDDPADK